MNTILALKLLLSFTWIDWQEDKLVAIKPFDFFEQINMQEDIILYTAYDMKEIVLENKEKVFFKDIRVLVNRNDSSIQQITVLGLDEGYYEQPYLLFGDDFTPPKHQAKVDAEILPIGLTSKYKNLNLDMQLTKGREVSLQFTFALNPKRIAPKAVYVRTYNQGASGPNFLFMDSPTYFRQVDYDKGQFTSKREERNGDTLQFLYNGQKTNGTLTPKNLILEQKIMGRTWDDELQKEVIKEFTNKVFYTQVTLLLNNTIPFSEVYRRLSTKSWRRTIPSNGYIEISAIGDNNIQLAIYYKLKYQEEDFIEGIYQKTLSVSYHLREWEGNYFLVSNGDSSVFPIISLNDNQCNVAIYGFARLLPNNGEGINPESIDILFNPVE